MDMKKFDIFTNADSKNGEYIGDTMNDLLFLLRMDGIIEAGRTPTGDNYKFFEWNWEIR